MRLKTERVSALLNRKASVVRKNNFHEARCTMSTASRAIYNGKHSLRSRFTTRIGTNPEKLVAAALCSSFSTGLIRALEISGFHAERIEATATLILEQLPDGPNVTRIQLDVHAKVPRATQAHFIDAAKAAAESPIARLLNATISMNASLDP
jgi:osmotically inducible protein OsmC